MPLQALWVEEEPESLTYERKLAQGRGWQITTVSSVVEALELLKNTRFDLLLVDLILPLDPYHLKRGHVNADAGLALVRSIRDPLREGATPADVPLVVVSAVVSPDRKSAVLESLASPTHYLAKPVEEAKYREILAEFGRLLTMAR